MRASGVVPRFVLFVSLVSLVPRPCWPQSTAAHGTGASALRETITAQDAALFGAVNRCDMQVVESMFAEDVEFYHDRNDPQYGRQTVVDAIRKNLCGKIQRELVPGTMEVYPIQGYGAVEIGVHRFHHIGSDDRDVVGEAKFIHLWRLKDGRWQITRVISYDHGTAAK